MCFFLVFQSEPVVVKPNEAGERLDDLIKSLQKVSSATPTTLSKSSSSSSSSAAVSSTSSSFKPQPLPPGGAAEASAMVNHMQVKSSSSEKATKIFEISTLLLSYVVPVKSKVEISQNFVAFSEYMNFI